MLDIRIETFLKLCETKSYTKTAEEMNVTQPTVTQHIQYLEKKYGAELVKYSGRVLNITSKGVKLRDLALAMRANNQKIEEEMKTDSKENREIRFGSTLTIGEYVMPDKIAEYILKYPEVNITMLVDNTEVLLMQLEEGKISFAVIEGFFDKQKYGHMLLKKAEYIGICANGSEMAEKESDFEDLLNERLITREKGSGTRDILENLLHENNLTIGSFNKRAELGNFNAIKYLVMNGSGISFVYHEVVKRELEEGKISRLNIKDLKIKREFNIVYLKDDLLLPAYKEFWDFIIA